MLDLVGNYEDNIARVSAEISRTEIIVHTQSELNENVRSIGQYLVDQVEVAIQHQNDIVDFHHRIEDMNFQNIQKDSKRAGELLVEIEQQQKKVNETGHALTAALEQWATENIIRQVFAVATVVGSLFAGGAGLSVGLANLPESATSIAKVAQKVTFVTQVINQVSEIYDQGMNLRNDIENFNRAMEFLSRQTVDTSDFPTELEWDDFDSEVFSYAHVGALPSQVAPEVLDFQTAAKKLSARGRAYLNLAKKVQALKYEVIVNELQRGIAERQTSRLSAFKNTLSTSQLSDYEANNTNLFELGNIFTMKANEVRTSLAQTYLTMDAALQYYYLQDPTPITGYDTLTIQEAAVQQVAGSISALENFPSKPHSLANPIMYNIGGVRFSSLLSKEGFKQRIPLSAIEFHEYVRVRVEELEVRVDGIIESANSTVYIQAEASGEITQDRDFNREPKTFFAYPVAYNYVYNITTGKTVVGTRPSEEFLDKFMKMTPFVEWTFRIPNVTTNRGIKFARDITTLRQKFYVNAVFHPAQLRVRSRRSDITGSVDTLLGKMSGYSALHDWDVVCAMDAMEINNLWKQKYEYEINHGGFISIINTDEKLTAETLFSAIYSSLEGVVGPPKISFIPHNTVSAKMVMPLLNATVHKKIYCKHNPYVTCGSDVPEVIFESECLNDTNAEINGVLDLTKVQGKVGQTKVILYLSSSTPPPPPDVSTRYSSSGARKKNVHCWDWIN